MRAGLAERAHVIPGGTLTRSKSIFGRWADCGGGSVITDTEGKQYIDMLCALGAVSLGYSELRSHDLSGGVYSLPHVAEIEAAETVLQHVAPWASWARFVKTGSESTHAAYRIAKAAVPRRPRHVQGDWAYHGWHEWCSLETPYQKHYERYAHGSRDLGLDDEDVFAVFVEPHRWEPVDVEWLRWLRAECDRTGTLLVFDSMIYGGRWHLGGTSGYFGVIPDMECFGKALGNGQSVAFVVGTDRTKPYGDIPSGTYSGDVVGLSAVIETVETYVREPIIQTLWDRGRQLASGLDTLVAAFPSSLAAREGAPVHQRLRFHNPSDGERFSQLMLDRGVIWHPQCVNVMAAHTEEQLARVLTAARSSLEAMA